MKQEHEPLWGEMISLARITDGNEHLITPESTELLRGCLKQISSGTAPIGVLIREIEKAKQNMVPDCFRCANPCGKTFPFDLGEIPEGEIRTLKYAVLDALCNHPNVEELLLYRALTVISLWGYEKEDLLSLIREIE